MDMKAFNNRHYMNQSNILGRFLMTCIIVSCGVFITSSGGGWDISNHLLNKPESFFTPPHSMMYSGVAISLVGAVLCFISYRTLNKYAYFDLLSQSVKRPSKFALIGMLLVVFSGPFDYSWHDAFGLDGLLSPSHFMLTSGLVVASSSSMVGIVRSLQFSYAYKGQKDTTKNKVQEQQPDFHYQKQNNETLVTSYSNNKKRFGSLLVVFSVIPVWLSMSGILYMFSLPFSNTEFFKFNPDPTAAVLVASLGYPFLISFILTLSGYLSNFRFGIVSLTGALFLVIGTFTSILPNESLMEHLPFYLVVNMTFFVCADAVMWWTYQKDHRTSSRHYTMQKAQPKNYKKNDKKDRLKSILFFAGGAISAWAFIFTYFPLVTYVYNEAMAHIQFYPHQLSTVYFDLVAKVIPVTVIPAAAIGVLGTVCAKKAAGKITLTLENEQK